MKKGEVEIQIDLKPALDFSKLDERLQRDFKENIKSMQYNHQDIGEARKNQEVGIKVDGKVREGDEVYRA